MKNLLLVLTLLLSMTVSSQVIQVAFTDNIHYQVVDEKQDYYLFEGNADQSSFFDIYMKDETYSGTMIIATENNRYPIQIGKKLAAVYFCNTAGDNLIWISEEETFVQKPNQLVQL